MSIKRGRADGWTLELENKARAAATPTKLRAYKETLRCIEEENARALDASAYNTPRTTNAKGDSVLSKEQTDAFMVHHRIKMGKMWDARATYLGVVKPVK